MDKHVSLNFIRDKRENAEVLRIFDPLCDLH